ncbi:SDR family NAD(P)-dependent oxidoreductase [Novosphingobium aquae]|jgi:NAD(P)-dependent dehydrogenase (short-subunit alcohol dehydrogenase family)|uniref:SDR family NAD(P)-dependent oxidoreductase n=1 Tax=Novosphingobium aquae TaxID=3133435 RepID=A0ABU8S7W0_9SPHN
MTRPVAVITGASAGIGKSAARMLVAKGWQVIGTGRDPSRSAAAIAEIEAAAQVGGSFTMLRGDFDSMADVKRVADEVKALTPRLDVLVNNAGGVRNRTIETADGTEATFAANHVAPFLLTRELLPLLKATAASQPAGSVRVIAVGSSAHRRPEGLDWDDLQSFGSDYNMAYCRAKLANNLFTRELARRVAGDGIVAQAMHPGVVASNFARHGDANMQKHMAAAPTVSPDEPAETIVWLATDPEGGREPGRYFYQKAEEAPSPAALDDAAAARLWRESEAILARIGV